MLRKRAYFFVLIFFFFVAGCSQKVIKPRVMSPSPEEKHISQKGDSAISSEDIAVDEFETVEFYYALGVSANQEGKWMEAQEHFENALDVLASLDIEEDSDSSRTAKFNMLLHEIAEDYKVTLLSLGVLSGESSVSAFLEGFESIENFKKLQEDFKKTGEVPLSEESWSQETTLYDIPIEWNERVENAIIYFQTVARDAFETYLRRSGKYKDLMQGILKEKGLPLDMVWLCLVESGFNPKAYSWARAMGPWQFIASTGRKYGLKRNWWYDERRDFVKSTYAACDYLSFLYDKFGSWPLALAGYNGGEGRVERAIQKHNTDNFWDLKLKRQTQNYVPLYMAATIIAKDFEGYGFNVEYEDPIQFDILETDEPLDLKRVAQVTGTSLETMEELNPELLRGVTPPNYPGYRLRIPVGTKEVLVEYLKKNPSKFASGLFIEHKVRKGETLSYLAKKYGVPLSVIVETNGLTNKHFLRVGQRLMIPSQKSSAAQSNFSDGKDEEVTYYTVKKGETLSDIASKFGITPNQIKKLNDLKNPNYIKTGQGLKIPVPWTLRTTNTTEGKTFVEHRVKKGETLSYLAETYGVSVSAIMEANHLNNKHQIKAGEYLFIPAKQMVTYSGEKSTEKTTLYTVRKGDTISDLALKFKTSPQGIKKLNGLRNLDNIKQGQKLKIPTANGEINSEGKWITYIVKRGDTLWNIAREFGVLVESLINWNEVKAPSQIKVGDRIKIFQTY